MSFETALHRVLDSEGGFVDDPRDPGGRTYKGITQRTLDRIRDRYPDIAFPADVKDLSDDQVAFIYKAEYWTPIKGEQLPAALALCLFDMAVNSGVTQAVRTLQRAIDVPVDGIIGPGTLGKALSLPTEILVSYFQAERVIYLVSLPTFTTFGRGWTRRVVATAIEACA